MAICGKCGSQISEGIKFCPKCGTQIVDKGMKFCPQCGKERKSFENFCPSCGYQFNKVAPNINNKTYDEITCEDTSNDNKKNVIAGVVIVFVVILGIFLIYLNSNHSSSSYNSSSTDIDSIGEVFEDTTEYSSNDDYDHDFYSSNNDDNYGASSSSSSSSMLSFRVITDVYDLLRNKSFVHREGMASATISYDSDCQFYINGEWNSGIFEVLRFNSEAAIIEYHSPSDGTMRLIVNIVGNKIQIKDPIDGSIYYQK